MDTLVGTGSCLRLAWRRNRLFWVLWILTLAVMMPMTAKQYATIIPPGTDPRATLEPLRNNPSMLALLGPAHDVYTKGGFVFWRVGGFSSCFAGMMAGFGIIRATRAEEDDGRLELLRSGVVGRHAPLAAGLLLGALGSLALAVATAGLALASGLPVAGSLAAGLAYGGNGLLFTGLGAVCAQVLGTARAARGWTLGVLFGGMFLARMVIDGSPQASWGWLRWLVPLEWGMLARPFAGERWWVLLLPLACFLGLGALSFRLESRRDHGAGLVQPRPGSAVAGRWLQGPSGLAWRLQRPVLLGWAAGLLLGAVGTGSIMGQMDGAVRANPQLGAMLARMGGTGNVMVAFYVAMLTILAGLAAVFAVQVLARLRTEEQHGRTEVLLATATSRTRLAMGHLLPALLVPCLVLVGAGAVLPLSQAGSEHHWALMGTYARSAAGLLPGLLLVLGIAMLLVGWLPRLSWLAWLVVGWTIFASWFAVLFDLPRWLVRLTPFGHLSALPRDTMHWTPFLVELALAVALLVFGLVGLRRRSIPA